MGLGYNLTLLRVTVEKKIIWLCWASGFINILQKGANEIETDSDVTNSFIPFKGQGRVYP